MSIIRNFYCSHENFQTENYMGIRDNDYYDIQVGNLITVHYPDTDGFQTRRLEVTDVKQEIVIGHNGKVIIQEVYTEVI